MTTRRSLALAKPEKASLGLTARLSTAPATASIAAVKSGNAFRMTERIAAVKTAKRRHASIVNPGGVGVSQITSARVNTMPCLISVRRRRRGSGAVTGGLQATKWKREER